MSAAFAHAEGDLADRLMAALEAAEREGGDVRGRQSAAVLVVPAEGEYWQTRINLRVEDHEDPIAELKRVLQLQRAYDLAGQGDSLMAADQPVEAGALYRRASELAPDSDELLFWSGLALAHSGDLEAGVDAVKRAIAVHQGWATLLDRLSPEFAPAGEQVRRAL
jgi:tetratricopeptide (TPR) repeat protein